MVPQGGWAYRLIDMESPSGIAPLPPHGLGYLYMNIYVHIHIHIFIYMYMYL